MMYFTDKREREYSYLDQKFESRADRKMGHFPLSLLVVGNVPEDVIMDTKNVNTLTVYF